MILVRTGRFGGSLSSDAEKINNVILVSLLLITERIYNRMMHLG